ncbi:MAG: tRNA uridine-5-carboxymethylaminomethyl(34) synthesis enzyme MnmG [candidate division Zixibacteria bacterium]|nr:tRNA uridine-5-carboxymethylaminomethyl(34) synthesis enzyme MnmG [candidate division Zixibacteria bacterium]MDH3936391.1 tRNA uridine-5-carboxymethylaminomethyl(34) synthesis enzyme MnmG [candidate division Zixibacteria bacterium]MDH4033501.1 tRNA uridine-5-carboxymethylaminomethyl(34) synthesis enzyme MnmG [candidate division Zixibacteria bacterium]
MTNRDFDIIVVGGGHAGVEAALAAARMGRQVALISMDKTKLALMSCNPAIGGIGKSHLVKEVDALGGLMAEAIDATGIQFRRLNLSRGPAVWSTRAQADRIRYNEYVCTRVSSVENIELIEETVDRLIVQNGAVCGVDTKSGRVISGQAVVICSGTFLSGLIHIGETQTEAGRMGEPAATGLSGSLREHGFETGRLKTGTPPRLDGDTVDYSRCRVQPGEEQVPFFSARSSRRLINQIPCYLTDTTAATKQLIRDSFRQSAMFSGQITATGPRYCPSIEDKFFRFPDKATHQVFLEPEGNGTSEVYPNGFSTALPESIQLAAIRTVTGLEQADLTRPGYAVEYDFCPPFQLKPSLETRRISGLFFAGQINGTSGYEEAAAQGLLAGLNAALCLSKQPPLILDRSEAYTGVMIDDLCTKPITEPYRMFTSRAEYRLALREDNARDRLSCYAQQYGLVDPPELEAFTRLQSETTGLVAKLEATRIKVADLGVAGERFQRADWVSLANLIRQPHLTLDESLGIVAEFESDLSEGPELLQRAGIQIRYKGYLVKQQREIDKFKRLETMTIPAKFDYLAITGLKKEAAERLARYRPQSLGQAGRLEGVSPGDLAILSVHLKRQGAVSE